MLQSSSSIEEASLSRLSKYNIVPTSTVQGLYVSAQYNIQSVVDEICFDCFVSQEAKQTVILAVRSCCTRAKQHSVSTANVDSLLCWATCNNGNAF